MIMDILNCVLMLLSVYMPGLWLQRIGAFLTHHWMAEKLQKRLNKEFKPTVYSAFKFFMNDVVLMLKRL